MSDPMERSGENGRDSFEAGKSGDAVVHVIQDQKGRMLIVLGADADLATALASHIHGPTEEERIEALRKTLIAGIEKAAPVVREAKLPSSPPLEPIRNTTRATRRNDVCPCGSGRKYKQCCLRRATR